MVEKERKEVWDIIEEVIRENKVIMKSEKKMKSIGIKEFEKKMIEGKEIKINKIV